MTTRSSIGSSTRPRDMFQTLLRPMAEADRASGCSASCASGGCRAKAMTRLNREGMAACQTGDYGQAERLLSQGIALASQAGVSMYEAKLRNNLGLVHLLASQPERAAGEFGQALGLVEGKLGRDNPLFERIQGNLRRAASH